MTAISPETSEEVVAPRYLNRELSWLDFNARVLALAADESVPLLERAKFLAIFSQNLDEFFQVRVAGLKDQLAAGLGAVTPDGRTPAEQLLDVGDRVARLVKAQERLFLHEVAPGLADVGVRFSSWADLDDDDEKFLVDTFEQRIFPVLTPLAVDPGHPFPYISDLSLNLAVELREPETGDRRFARVKVPDLLPRFVVMPDGERFVPLEQVIAAHLGQLFPGMVIDGHHAFRVTRNADLTLEEEDADDLLAAVELELRRRRFGRAVRLEVADSISAETLDLLQRELDVADDDTYRHAGPLDLGGLWAVHDLERPDLKDQAWVPVTQLRLDAEDPVDVFSVIRDGDVLVHHPYDSFTTSTEEFIRQAARDPQVLAIKMTLYRTSGDSPIVKNLIRAAERGKQVAALVELKARFDEGANIEWARALETAGVHVVYGLVGLKVHTKTALVVRDEPEGVRRYCHVGTGNYNGKTARIYEDVGLLTADSDIGADLTQLFNYLTGYGRDVRYEKLLVAPHSIRPGLGALIRSEIAAARAGRPAAITLKMNSLVDAAMIDLLYEASQAGVEVDLVVRGICCLIPGVPGRSERIRVRSIVGRYLEHSRIYRFANGAGPGRPTYLIGSADLMPRNLDRRVEALVPVDDPALQERLEEVLQTVLADDTLAWTLDAEGGWRHVEVEGTVDTHLRLQDRALARARRRA
ncbi:MAG: RNA degradosome polyphosphate kinase [Acidimicrobiia bacterium]